MREDNLDLGEALQENVSISSIDLLLEVVSLRVGTQAAKGFLEFPYELVHMKKLVR